MNIAIGKGKNFMIKDKTKKQRDWNRENLEFFADQVNENNSTWFKYNI